MQTFIPFSGFYNSLHDNALDHELAQEVSDDQGNTYPIAYDRAFGKMNWTAVHVAYAEAYTKLFSDEFGIKLKFAELISPREYNFTTDRILCDISRNEVRRVYRATAPSQLTSVALEWFTSRSGFISFYSNNPDTWGGVDHWDANQVGCMVAAFVLQHREGKEFDDWAQASLMEPYFCNGHAHNAFYDNCPELARIGNAVDWMRRRRIDSFDERERNAVCR